MLFGASGAAILEGCDELPPDCWVDDINTGDLFGSHNARPFRGDELQQRIPFLPARRCASAVQATALWLCPSVRPSQVEVLSKRMNGSSWFRAEVFFHLSYSVFEEIRVSPKLGLHTRWNSARTLEKWSVRLSRSHRYAVHSIRCSLLLQL